MRYDASWVPPWRPGQPQAPCRGPDCSLHPTTLCVASTLVNGLCVQCAKREGATALVAREPVEQLVLDGL